MALDLSQVTAYPGTVAKGNDGPSLLETMSEYPVLAQVADVYKTVKARRVALNLPNPGTIENITKETSRDVFLGNYFFTGLRADLSKSLSMNPAFQVSHGFCIGSPSMPSYSFTGFYGTDNVLLQGNVDNDMGLSGRLHYGWSNDVVSKANLQLAPGQPGMLQMEHEVRGCDYTLNAKALNPSVLDNNVLTGVFIGSLLQSVTPKLAIGLETMYSKGSAAMPGEAAMNYYARYASGDWVAAMNLQASGSLLGSFYRKVTDRVEAGIETSLSLGGQQQMMMGLPPTVEANTTVGAKYEFRQACFRGQVDSAGKVSCLLEQRVLPMLTVLFAGEINHKTNEPRIGVGLQFESGGEELYQHAEASGQPLTQARPPM